MWMLSSNPSKFQEIADMIPGLQRLGMDLPEIQHSDPVWVIRAKLDAAKAQEEDKRPLFVEDTSLGLHCLNGLPGPFIKWFLDKMGSSGVANIAVNFNESRATARTMIGLLDEDNKVQFFEGLIDGRIVVPRVKTTFGWDNIFVPDGHGTTFAEMTAVEKNAISMRKMAVDKLIAYIRSQKRGLAKNFGH